MILLDSHVLIWLALQPEKLSARAKDAIRTARREGGLAVAAITLWEIAWLAHNGRIQTSATVESFVRECTAKVTVLPMSPTIAALAVSFPDTFPKDPQDRLIGATALNEGIALVTHDKLMRKSGLIQTIW